MAKELQLALCRALYGPGNALHDRNASSILIFTPIFSNHDFDDMLPKDASKSLWKQRTFFDLFNEKRNGVIEFEEFIHAFNVFHSHTLIEDKIECK